MYQVGTEPLYLPECTPDGAICLTYAVIKKCVNVDQKQWLNNCKTDPNRNTNPNRQSNPKPY